MRCFIWLWTNWLTPCRLGGSLIIDRYHVSLTVITRWLGVAASSMYLGSYASIRWSSNHYVVAASCTHPLDVTKVSVPNISVIFQTDILLQPHANLELDSWRKTTVYDISNTLLNLSVRFPESIRRPQRISNAADVVLACPPRRIREDEESACTTRQVFNADVASRCGCCWRTWRNSRKSSRCVMVATWYTPNLTSRQILSWYVWLVTWSGLQRCVIITPMPFRASLTWCAKKVLKDFPVDWGPTR